MDNKGKGVELCCFPVLGFKIAGVYVLTRILTKKYLITPSWNLDGHVQINGIKPLECGTLAQLVHQNPGSPPQPLEQRHHWPRSATAVKKSPILKINLKQPAVHLKSAGRRSVPYAVKEESVLCCCKHQRVIVSLSGSTGVSTGWLSSS